MICEGQAEKRHFYLQYWPYRRACGIQLSFLSHITPKPSTCSVRIRFLVFWFRVFYFSTKKVFHKDWRIRRGTIGGDLYLGYLFVCPSRVEVSFSSTLEVPSRVEVVHEKALLETRYL
jgi:hypothetical protein